MTISRVPIEDTLTGGVWGGIFFHPLFTNTAKRYLDLIDDPVYLNHDNDPVCAINLQRHRRPFISSATVPLLFQYYGAIFLKKDFPSELIPELNAYFRSKCDYAIFSFPPVFPFDMLSGGWEMADQITLAIDSDDLRSWGRGFKDDVKNKINKAKRESVEISEISSLPQDLWATAYMRKKLAPPIEPSILTKWCDSLQAESLLKIFAATIDGRPIAFRGELIFGDYAYDWIAGSDPEYHNLGANQLLMAEIGENISRSGVKIWDLVGGQIKSIYDFKKSFGAREYIYRQGTVCYNIKGKIYSFFRNLKHGKRLENS